VEGEKVEEGKTAGGKKAEQRCDYWNNNVDIQNELAKCNLDAKNPFVTSMMVCINPEPVRKNQCSIRGSDGMNGMCE
jgi:hypothetical protein